MNNIWCVLQFSYNIYMEVKASSFLRRPTLFAIEFIGKYLAEKHVANANIIVPMMAMAFPTGATSVRRSRAPVPTLISLNKHTIIFT